MNKRIKNKGIRVWIPIEDFWRILQRCEMEHFYTEPDFLGEVCALRVSECSFYGLLRACFPVLLMLLRESV